MALPHPKKWTAEDYLEFEETSLERHELLDGDIYAMAGASKKHNYLGSAVGYLLYGQLLDRSCDVFQSEMRIQVSERTYFYPDVVVACGAAQFKDKKENTLLNPSVIFEILSPSTETFDRTSKFQQYRLLLSLREYVLISQTQMLVEHYTRQTDNTWVLRDLSAPEDELVLASIGCTLRLADIYRKVVFEDVSED
jgi:Uma2 family endonuclease